jgi:hypothetical protein
MYITPGQTGQNIYLLQLKNTGSYRFLTFSLNFIYHLLKYYCINQNTVVFLYWFFIGYWILKRGRISIQPFFFASLKR